MGGLKKEKPDGPEQFVSFKAIRFFSNGHACGVKNCRARGQEVPVVEKSVRIHSLCKCVVMKLFHDFDDGLG